MNIYSILASKPHNPHYLNRYITFIEQCQQKNVDYEGYVEYHHICPKAKKDMFPEYKDFRLHPWNCAVLTARQHFIAHIMLWKAFPNINSQTYAIYAMKNKNNMKMNSRLYESLKIDSVRKRSVDSSYEQRELVRKGIHHFCGDTNPTYNMSDETKKKISNTMKEKAKSGNFHLSGKGKVSVRDSTGRVFRTTIDDDKIKTGEVEFLTVGRVTVKDTDGNTFSVSKDDPRFVSGELVGITKGKISVKDKDGNTFSVDKNDPRFVSGELVGVNKGKKGKISVKDKDGNTFSVDKNDPRFISGELVGVRKKLND